MREKLESWLQRAWYGGSRWYVVLVPLGWIFSVFSILRTALYHTGVLRTYDVGVPVVVVGNITAGGTGKTPVTLWIAHKLAENGWRPGIISRGYGGNAGNDPIEVKPDSDPSVVGDEALLMSMHCNFPVVVHPDRIRAARVAIQRGARVLVADDGLQHYRLHRNYEVALVDGERAFGNGHMLPAGPLREPVSRLELVDEVLLQQGAPGQQMRFGRRSDDLVTSKFRLVPSVFRSLDNQAERPLDIWAGRKVHAIAGISHPGRFFRLLEHLKIEVIEHPFPDHAPFEEADTQFDDELPVVMTEKDAVKCRRFARDGLWYLPVSVEFADAGNMVWLTELMRHIEEYVPETGA